MKFLSHPARRGVGIIIVFGDLLHLTIKDVQAAGMVTCIYQALSSISVILSLLPYRGHSMITEGQDLNTTVNEVWDLCHESSIHQRDADATEVGNQAQFRHLQEAKVREPRDRGSGFNLSLTLGNEYDFYRPVIPVL